MLRLTSLAFLLFGAGSSVANPASDVVEGAGAIGLIAKFRQWVTEHGKRYETEAEELLRLKVWTSNHGECMCNNCCCCWLVAGLLLGCRSVGESFVHLERYSTDFFPRH